MLSEHRDDMAADTFFKQAINGNGFPHKVVMDKSGANYAGIENINLLLMLAGLISFFHSAKATIDGIETAHMIRKGQLSEENLPAYKQFMALAG